MWRERCVNWQDQSLSFVVLEDTWGTSWNLGPWVSESFSVDVTGARVSPLSHCELYLILQSDLSNFCFPESRSVWLGKRGASFLRRRKEWAGASRRSVPWDTGHCEPLSQLCNPRGGRERKRGHSAVLHVCDLRACCCLLQDRSHTCKCQTVGEIQLCLHANRVLADKVVALKIDGWLFCLRVMWDRNCLSKEGEQGFAQRYCGRSSCCGQNRDMSFTFGRLAPVIMLEISILWGFFCLVTDVLLKHLGGVKQIYTARGIYANLPNSKTLRGSKSMGSSWVPKPYGNGFS